MVSPLLKESALVREWSNERTRYQVRSMSGTTYFVKEPYLVDPTQSLSPEERSWVDAVASSFPPFQWWRKPSSVADLVRREAETLLLWEAVAIPAPRLMFVDDVSICTEYLEGENVKSFIELGRSLPRQLESLCETYQRIRAFALETNDVKGFHADPKLKNFFVLENSVMAVDPANVLNPDLSVEEIDARLNLYFLYGAYTLNIDNCLIERLLRTMIGSFDSKTQERMIDDHERMMMLRKQFPKDLSGYVYRFDNYTLETISKTMALLRRVR